MKMHRNWQGKIYRYTLAALGFMLALVTSQSFTANAAVSYSTFDIYRLLNVRNGDHLYTADEKEIVATSCPSPTGYQFEGFMGSYAQPSGTIVHLFRLYNAKIHKHFYTTSVDEKSFAMSRGYSYEGVDVSVQTVRQTQFEPAVHRFYNARTGDHFYTHLQSEIDTVAQLGYADEGIVWYLPDNSTTHETMTLVRMYNPNLRDHFYASKGEWQSVGCSNPQYKYEGAAFKGFACNSPLIYCNQNNRVSRYFNKNTGIHLYSTGDENGALSTSSWVYEGYWWYRDPSVPPTATALNVYRLRNPVTGAYLFTINADEKNKAMTQGWVFESIPFTAEPI